MQVVLCAATHITNKLPIIYVPPQPVLYPCHDGLNGKINGSADAILLYDFLLPYSMKEISESHGKEMGGPWECYNAGWEAERVVAVTTGGS